METRLMAHEMEPIRVKLNFRSCLSMNLEGNGGELAMLWNDDLDAMVVSYSNNHIDMIIGDDGSMDSWRLTGIYGQPEMHKRGKTWTLLQALHGQMHKPWVSLVDFNEILRLAEKHGAGVRVSWQMDHFWNAFQDSSLADMQCEGSVFTWNNGRRG
ncbi:hypothetical protein CFOL_v3_14824 [Cephalotus follicularis]|uniref:Exo_endo_phos domain-containing protein n=1 Tax=Cephalotus follicularis TaxID=3775 RepID=A0A1Q3BTP6_CEPFO|nr:hypothetical protein CFOL_v3_14824 [Cephalotus follicularis]